MATKRDPIEAFVSQWEPKIRGAFLEAIDGIKSRASIAAIARRLADGDVEGAVRAVGIDPNDFVKVRIAITSTYGNYGVGVTGGIPAKETQAGAIIKTIFDDRSARADAWLRGKSSTLLKDITDDQTAMVRAHLADGLASGKKVDAIARGLVGKINPRTGKREGGVIGLTKSQEEWQRKYAAELSSADPIELKKALGRGLRDKRFDAAVNKAIAEGKKIPADIQAKMVAAYRNKSLEYRAKTIANNEVHKAMSAAQTEGWQQAIDRGQISTADVRRFWKTRDDTRVRPDHQRIPAMNKGGRAWGEAFDTPSGPSMHAPHDTDPMCRCMEEIRLVYFGGK